MRIQIQGSGVEESVTGINLPDPGVLKRQMNVAASQLFLKAQSGSITNFPKDHISALGAALGHLTIFINKATGISQGGTVQTAQWDQPSGRDLRTGANKQSIKRPGTYRTDLENSRGTNLNK